MHTLCINCSVFGRPSVKRFALCYPSVVLSVLSVCLYVTFVHYGKTVGRIKMKLGKQLSLGPGHVVLDGGLVPPPLKGGAETPEFLAHICCGQVAAGIEMPLGMEVELGPGDFV